MQIGKITVDLKEDTLKIYKNKGVSGSVEMTKKQAISLARVINIKYEVKESARSKYER